jgi:hypothetical protein
VISPSTSNQVSTLRQGEFRDNSFQPKFQPSIVICIASPPRGDVNGRTPLCWCLTAGRLTKAHYQLATFLIENGCDVLKAHRGWNQSLDVHDPHGPTLLDIVCLQPRTTTNLRFTQYFGEKLARADITIAFAARFPPPGTSAVDSCRPM